MKRKMLKKRGSVKPIRQRKIFKWLDFNIWSASMVIFGFTGMVLYKYQEYKMKYHLKATLSSLLDVEASAKVNPNSKVAVGFGSCKDLIVQSKYVLIEPPNLAEHVTSIETYEDFSKIFAYFFDHGAAAERYISNETLFKELVDMAVKAPDARYSIGGNAAVMANRFIQEGCKVLLGAQVSQSLAKLFPKGMVISGPKIKTDDIHMLLEYSSGEVWGKFKASRANRFIIHNDHHNPSLSSLEKFSLKMKDFSPDLLVVSGLQMMDNFPMNTTQRQERLTEVQLLMKNISKESSIHFEMASFSEKNLVEDVIDLIIPYVDSLGMNEQELPNLLHVLKYKTVSVIAEANPRIAVTLNQMRELFEILQNSNEDNKQKALTRLHVHTLAFHALMTQKNSMWKNNEAALAKAVLTANRHTCGSNEIDIDTAKLIMDDSFTTGLDDNSRKIPFDAKKPIACWDEGNLEVCVAPVLVCTKVLQTGGGGDNISAAGLVLQI